MSDSPPNCQNQLRISPPNWTMKPPGRRKHLWGSNLPQPNPQCSRIQTEVHTYHHYSPPGLSLIIQSTKTFFLLAKHNIWEGPSLLCKIVPQEIRPLHHWQGRIWSEDCSLETCNGRPLTQLWQLLAKAQGHRVADGSNLHGLYSHGSFPQNPLISSSNNHKFSNLPQTFTGLMFKGFSCKLKEW